MKKKLRMNPILKKDLMVGSRSMKMSLTILGINLCLVLMVLFVMVVTNIDIMYSGYDYSSLMMLFPVLGVTECILLSIIVPIITSGSISGERERQTLDVMLTTPVKPFSIAVGKLSSAMALVMMYIVSAIPILAIAFVLGGLNWGALFGLIAMLLYIGIYVGSVGVFCSSVVKKSVAATILTIAIGLGIVVGTVVIFSIWEALIAYRVAQNNLMNDIGNAPLIFLVNPYSPMVDFLLRSMSSVSIYDLVEDSVPSYTGWIYQFWMPISIVLNLLISLGFLKLAANNICVTKNRKKAK